MARTRAIAPAVEPTASSPMMDLLARHPRAVVLACFFLSGATGLVYEVLWSRRLTLVFGVTVLAVSTVLAAFMGGLALGSVLFGRVADQRRDPLRVYAALEGLIGLYCFATPWLFEAVEAAYVAIHPALAGSPLLLRLARFVLALLVLLPPTMLMGGTLPALTRALSQRLAGLGGRVAALYGTNTLGATLGAMAGGFLLIPAIGIRQTVYLTAVLNLAIALVAWALHLAWRADEPAEPEPSAEAEAPEPEPAPAPLLPRAAAWLLLAYGLCGAASMVYEVGWTRVLALSLGTSTYAFSTMLAAFLAGIGLGSVVLARWRPIAVDRLRAPLLAFGIVELAIGVLVTVLTPALDRLPFAFLALFRTVGPRFWPLEAGTLGISLLVMLAPALLMGYAFPLVTRLATESLGVVGRRIGTVYAANTVGTVIGSFVAGFVLIPWIGVRAALAVGVALNLIVGAGYLLSARGERPRLATAGLVIAGLTAVGWFVLPDWNRAVLSSGAYVYPTFYLSGPAEELMGQKEVLYYRDALTTTVSVTRVTMPGAPEALISLQINGKTDASTGDLSTQLLLAHLPSLLHGDPRSALVVGLASGCTVGALGVYDELERLTCVEIEPAMVEASDYFRAINRDCLDDPRLTLVLDDARNHLLVTRARYDIITSEPSNPWISGVANLFTREYFELCRERLTEGGVYCQWLPLYNLAPQDLRTILGTFREVFPECSLWAFPALTTDAFLIGTKAPLAIDVVSVVEGAAQAEVAADLRSAGVRDAWDFLAGYLFGAEIIEGLGFGAQRNTDDFPIIEFTSPMTLHTGVARITTEEVLRLAAQSSPPLGRCTRAVDGRVEDALSGLTAFSPWTEPQAPDFTTLRDVAGYLGGQRERAVRCATSMRWRLGVGEASVEAYRRAALPAGIVTEPPARDPDRTLDVGPGSARIWLGPGLPSDARWLIRWSNPEQDRVYLISASPGDGPSPEEALGALAPMMAEPAD